MISPEKHNSGDSPSLRTTSHRPISPSGSFCSSTISSSSSDFTSSISTPSSPARSTSPTTITVRRSGCMSSSPSIQFSIHHRHTSPHRTVSSSSNINRSCNNNSNVWSYGSKKMCLCSPTTHRGSFRCSLHKHSNTRNGDGSYDNTASYCYYRLYARRSAMSNSVVRIGTVEGDLVKRTLAALIRPSSHHRRRRSAFQPRRSRLSVMSNSDD